MNMETRVVYADKGYVLYCDRCYKEYTKIEVITPIIGLSEYFICDKCNNTIQARKMKMKRKYKFWFFSTSSF